MPDWIIAMHVVLILTLTLALARTVRPRGRHDPHPPRHQRRSRAWTEPPSAPASPPDSEENP